MSNNYFVCGAKVLKRDVKTIELNYINVVKKVDECLRKVYLGGVYEIAIRKGCKPYIDSLKPLYQCYSSCSYEKEHVYNYCRECAEEINNALNVYCDCGVSSYNTFMFTYGICFTINNVIYYLYITPSKNTLYIYPQD